MTSDITPITAVSLGGTTAQTALEIPDCVTMITPVGKRSIDALAEYAADLLAENSDLPAPVYFSVSEAGQEVSLQFADTPDSFRALAEWAERFGGTITGCPHPRDNGRQSVHCEVKFTDRGVKVEAYAFITAPRPHPLRPDTSAGPGGRPSPGPASHTKPIRSAFERGEWRDQRYQDKDGRSCVGRHAATTPAARELASPRSRSSRSAR